MTTFRVELLDWDSQCFGYKIARVVSLDRQFQKQELASKLLALKAEGTVLVYAVFPALEKEYSSVINELGGELVDEKVTYSRRISPQDKIDFNKSEVVSFLHQLPSKELVELALQSGICSRFRIDPHFIHGEFELLYKTWLHRSLSGEIAKDVLVFVNQEKVFGFITLAEKQGHGEIGLFAVDREVRGQSIGSQLMTAALAKFQSWQLPEIQVVTQGKNLTACHFYEKHHFQKEKTEFIYHFWL